MTRPLLFLLILFFIAPFAHAQIATAPLENTQEIEKAQVISIEKSGIRRIPGTDTDQNYQTLLVKVLSGSDKSKTLEVENDYLALKPGAVFFLVHTINAEGHQDFYAVSEPDRLPALAVLFVIFLVAVVIVGGWTGLRGLLALAASFLFILYGLLPGILAGYDPTLVAAGVAMIIIIVGSYLTHGWNRTTSAAVVGMIATIIVTAVIAYAAVAATQLSGFNDENAVYLNFATRGHIDFVGLLLGGILIAVLGVLYDAAIAQAVAVEELIRAAPTSDRRHIFRRAMRIGREHIGALVNTLAIAYVGVSLPLLLLFTSYADESVLITLNRDIFASEIVRAIVGSLGIILAVPISTLAAVLFLKQHTANDAKLDT